MADTSIGPQEILETLTTSIQAAKAVSGSIQSALDKVGSNRKALEALTEAQKLAISVQTSVLEAKEQVLALQEENRQLRAEIREKEEKALDREQYERRKAGNATVVVRKGEPDSYLCASCFEAEKKGSPQLAVGGRETIGGRCSAGCSPAVRDLGGGGVVAVNG